MKTLLLCLSFLSISSVWTNEEIWTFDYEKALTIAKEQDKQVLMVFSGSDWCKPCIKLRQEVLDQEAFQAYATEHLVLLEVDFPRSRKNRLAREQVEKNESLAAQYNPEGAFPKMLLFGADEKLLGQIQYLSDDPVDLIRQIKAILP